MGFVHRFWRFFRLGLLVVAFIGIGLYLLATTNWEKLFGWQPTYEATITEGQPIAAAIYHFKADRGLWPQYLDDLVPDYVSQNAFGKIETSWYYTIARDGRPGLSKATDQRRTHVGFDFDPVKPSWLIYGDEDNRVLKTMTPASAAGGGSAVTTLPAEKVADNELAELDRRIAREPQMMEHRRAKASLLRTLQRNHEARQVIDEAEAVDGNHFWPRLARVAIEPEAGGTLPEFDRWVREHPTFTHWYYLSLAHRLSGQDQEAIAAVEEAAKLPPATSEDDFEITAFYLWDMARYALQQEKWALVLQLAQAWEHLQSDDRRKKEESHLALAAAAKLAQGDIAGAKKDMETLRERNSVPWAQNRDALEAAIKRGDRTFRYDPGNQPPPFEVFAVPQ
jgi:tetratricopeptide (TPR) repeat protein